MTKRYRETLDEVRCDEHPDGRAGAARPCEFAWRGHRYQVTQVLGHWHEDPGWWRRPDGQPIRIEQTDMWRVEARDGRSTNRRASGVYELVRRGDTWRLDRVWD